MTLKTRKPFIIPAGTIVTEAVMKWIKDNCISERDISNYDLPEGWDKIFKGKI